MTFRCACRGNLVGLPELTSIVHPTFLLSFFAQNHGLASTSLFIVALFGCVVLHELGHALMARRFGIETLDITLYPIGGVARLQRMPRAPGAELLIALAGPAVNFAIVAVLMGLEFLGIGGIESDLSPGGFLGALMIMNLILGIFNLIPAFPMDGGRVLRALLSGWVGRVRATSVAATIGRGLALAFGIYSLYSGNFLSGGSCRLHLLCGRRRGSPACWPKSAGESMTCLKTEGIWTAPPGYHWVHQGNGIWQLAPVIVTSGTSGGIPHRGPVDADRRAGRGGSLCDSHRAARCES